jgi:hypothetical protein
VLLTAAAGLVALRVADQRRPIADIAARASLRVARGSLSVGIALFAAILRVDFDASRALGGATAALDTVDMMATIKKVNTK